MTDGNDEKPSLYERLWPDEEQEKTIEKRNPFWRELPLSHRLWPDMGPPKYIEGLTSERAIRYEWEHWLASLYKKDKDHWD